MSDDPAAARAPTYTGRFSDGRTARTLDAAITLEPAGLTIRAAELPAPVVWPFLSLRTARPISRASNEVVVTSSRQETASLFVADPVFVEALRRVAPHLRRSGRFGRRAAPWLALAAGIAAIIGLVWALDLSPARAVARLLPERARQALGKQAIESMTRGKRVCEAAEGKAALARMASRLTAAADGAPRFEIIVVDWSLMNAFAVPGGRIVLTSGLIAKTEGPDEVAGVLAHEMGHGLEMHPETGIVRAIGLTALADLLFGSGTLTNLGVTLAQMSYSRAAEHQADLHALRLLKGAAISTKGLQDFFNRVDKIESGKVLKPFDMFRSHPVTAERARLVAEQPPYPATPALGPEDWAALRTICTGPAKLKI